MWCNRESFFHRNIYFAEGGVWGEGAFDRLLFFRVTVVSEMQFCLVRVSEYHYTVLHSFVLELCVHLTLGLL